MIHDRPIVSYMENINKIIISLIGKMPFGFIASSFKHDVGNFNNIKCNIPTSKLWLVEKLLMASKMLFKLLNK